MPGPRVGPLGTARERLGSFSTRDTVKTETFCILQICNTTWWTHRFTVKSRESAQISWSLALPHALDPAQATAWPHAHRQRACGRVIAFSWL